MKKLIYISLIILFGCSLPSNEFVVKSIYIYEGECEYFITPAETNFSVHAFRFTDKCEKFDVGDTVKIMNK